MQAVSAGMGRSLSRSSWRDIFLQMTTVGMGGLEQEVVAKPSDLPAARHAALSK